VLYKSLSLEFFSLLPGAGSFIKGSFQFDWLFAVCLFIIKECLQLTVYTGGNPPKCWFHCDLCGSRKHKGNVFFSYLLIQTWYHPLVLMAQLRPSLSDKENNGGIHGNLWPYICWSTICFDTVLSDVSYLVVFRWTIANLWLDNVTRIWLL
jgi:hypothetical protein